MEVIKILDGKYAQFVKQTGVQPNMITLGWFEMSELRRFNLFETVEDKCFYKGIPVTMSSMQNLITIGYII